MGESDRELRRGMAHAAEALVRVQDENKRLRHDIDRHAKNLSEIAAELEQAREALRRIASKRHSYRHQPHNCDHKAALDSCIDIAKQALPTGDSQEPESDHLPGCPHELNMARPESLRLIGPKCDCGERRRMIESVKDIDFSALPTGDSDDG